MYRVSAQDNDLYFFREREDVRRCATCRLLLDKWNEDLSSVPIAHLPKYDLSYSYDGVLVATRAFKEAVESAAIGGMIFRPLQRGLFWAGPQSTVAFDAARRGTKFEDLCPTCGQYEAVTGAAPVYLADGVTVEGRVFVRTDLEFGSADEKSPVVLCSDEAQRELKRRKLKGVDLMAK